MPSTFEAILRALKSVLEAETSATISRISEVEGEFKVAAGGRVIIEPGDPVLAETTMSPLAYTYDHGVDLSVYVKGEGNDAAFDALKVAIGTALAADRQLGGACSWLDMDPPVPNDDPFEGASSVMAGVIPLTIRYTTSNPLT